VISFVNDGHVVRCVFVDGPPISGRRGDGNRFQIGPGAPKLPINVFERLVIFPVST